MPRVTGVAMSMLAAAMVYCLLVVAVDRVAVAIIVAHNALSIDWATTAGATTDVGVTMIGLAALRLSTLRDKKSGGCGNDEVYK